MKKRSTSCAAALVGVREQAHELPARPVLDVGVDDHAFGLRDGAGLQSRERHDARVVLVAQRQVQHEVGVARDAELDELVGEAAAGGLHVRGLYFCFASGHYGSRRGCFRV